MIENSQATEGSVKSDRHAGISSAINNIDSVESHLDNLISRIKGVPGDERPKCEYSEPSLSDVINGSEECIRNYIDSLHSKINDIEQLLF